MLGRKLAKVMGNFVKSMFYNSFNDSNGLNIPNEALQAKINEIEDKIASISNEIKPQKIFFKKNCPDWTTPRVYLFSQFGNLVAPHLDNYLPPWDWEDSPYMEQDKNDPDLYYIDLPTTKYNQIIFFCDEEASGFNYKTKDLVIPVGQTYPTLCYWQSPIGYDGIWIDRDTNSFSLFLQVGDNPHSITVDDEEITGQRLGVIGVGCSYEGQKYTKYQIPLSSEKIIISIREQSKEYSVHELCYNIPICYLKRNEDWANGYPPEVSFNIDVFDGGVDSEFMFDTRYSIIGYNLYRDIYRNLYEILYKSNDNEQPSGNQAIEGYNWYILDELCQSNTEYFIGFHNLHLNVVFSDGIKYSVNWSPVNAKVYNMQAGYQIIEFIENGMKCKRHYGDDTVYCINMDISDFDMDNMIMEISYDAFENPESITTLTIPKNCTYVDGQAIKNCTNLTTLNYNASNFNNLNIFKYLPQLDTINIGDSVICIPSMMFIDWENLKNVTIGNSVIDIGGWTFSNCTNLENVTIGNSVTSISDYAFSNCTNLKNIKFSNPNSIANIGKWVFNNTAWYDNLSDGLTYIGKIVYKYKGDCPETIILKEDIVGIAGEAFRDCNNLKNIEISERVTNIGDGAFYGCTSLESITIPNSVTSIGSNAFADCYSLKSITVSDSVTYIGYGAFDTTTWYGIQPDGLVYVGKIAYNYKGDCPANVVIREDTTAIADCAFQGCTSLTSISIPYSVCFIGNGAFSYCTSLTNITIPNSVAQIEPCAFQGCTSLISATIPNSVISIGWGIFYESSNLENVILESGFNANGLDLSASTLYTAETIVSWLESLADRTGLDTYSLNIGQENINKLTYEQIAIATEKNWTIY